MVSSRNLVTLVLLIGVGALGWVGGSLFSGSGSAIEGQRPSELSAAQSGKDDHAGHGHTEKKDVHAGHDHAEKTEAHAGHGHGDEAGAEDICPEHRLPEAEDVLCNPGLMTTLLPGQGVKMRLATAEAATRAGIVIAAAKSTGLAGGPAIPAQVAYNRGKLADVVALSGGTVRHIAAEPGQAVGKGAMLAEIASPGAALARSDYQGALARLQLAEANVRREQELVAKGVSARLELEQAQAEQQAASAAVEQLRAQLAAFGAGGSGSGTALALRSPLSGTVVARNVVTGQTLAPETPLFTVADLSSMWLEMQASSDQAAQIRVGTPIEAEIDGLPSQRFPGKIVQVGAGLDARTRLLQVVAEVANPDGQLKAGMFGKVQLAAAGETSAGHDQGIPTGHVRNQRPDLEDLFAKDDHAQQASHHDDHDHAGHPGEAAAGPVAVPAAAVQSIDGKAYVFVAHAEPDLFELRRVETGPRRAGEVVILAGLQAGENVAASQGFALKSEVLKSRLGASCADH